jgi:hypothetical protein
MEKNNLAISTTNTDFITCHGLDTFNTLSADILCKDEEFIFDLETAKIST